MDSLTQIVLGAGVAELMIGKKIGNKAMLIGAIAGTIPDLDVLLTIGSPDPLTELRVHRSYSHSMFTHLVLAAPLAWLTFKIWKKEISFSKWYWVWFMGLFTHAILDCFTTYGTRLFLPFTDYLVGLNNVSVIDPLYTLPFMILLIVAMCYKRHNPKRFKIAKAAMLISSAYMLLTFGFKYAAHQKFTSELKRQNIAYNSLSTSPTIFNSILWAGMATTDSTLIVGEYSLLQSKKDIEFMTVPRNRYLMTNHPAKDITKTLLWFGQGIDATVPATNDSLHFIAAKWGRFDYDKNTPREAFVMYYTIYKTPENLYKVAQADPSKVVDFKKAFQDLWNRIFHF